MAKKRMISADLLDNDVFLDLSISAKALYFYLILKADDDGMVAKPKSVVREIQATNDDLQSLIDTRYILSFPSGVICIKHWRIHNAIPKDRYKPTTYQEELSNLIVRSDGSYTEKERHRDTTFENTKESAIPVSIGISDVIAMKYIPRDSSPFDLWKSWEIVRSSYPRQEGIGMMARTLYNDLFIRIDKDQQKSLANYILRGISIYKINVQDRYGDEATKYYKSFDKWLKDDVDYYIDEAIKEYNQDQDD